jgi:hypothetical protein
VVRNFFIYQGFYSPQHGKIGENSFFDLFMLQKSKYSEILVLHGAEKVAMIPDCVRLKVAMFPD